MPTTETSRVPVELGEATKVTSMRATIRNVVIGSLLAAGLVFAFDMAIPQPVIAEVISTQTVGVAEVAEVRWVDGEGQERTAQQRLPEEYRGMTHVPVVADSYIGDGNVTIGWYLGAMLIGGLIAGPIGSRLRPSDYEENPPRQVVTMAGT